MPAAATSRKRTEARVSDLPDLPDRLARLAERASSSACPTGVNDMIRITALREHRIRSVSLERPILGIILHGAKRMLGDGIDECFAVGDLFMARARRGDAINQPDPVSGRYQTLVVTLCDEVLEAARVLLARPIAPCGDAVARSTVTSLAPELARWLDALDAGDATQARLSLAAIVLRLATDAREGLLTAPELTLAGRLRDQIMRAPTHDWRSPEVEAALNLSGATLRRRLAAEGSSLRQVITEARLTCGLNLLFSTDLPVKTVAARVGYQSAASFTRRFQDRFGLSPTDIGR